MRLPWISILVLAWCLGIAGGAANAGPLHDAARAGEAGEVRRLIAEEPLSTTATRTARRLLR